MLCFLRPFTITIIVRKYEGIVQVKCDIRFVFSNNCYGVVDLRPTMNDTTKKTLAMTVSSLLSEVGFDAAETDALEILTEAMGSVLWEIGKASHSYCELSGRTVPLVGDVVVGLADMGISLEEIRKYSYRRNRRILPPVTKSVQSKEVNTLRTGVKHPHPHYVPDHLPQFPDPCTYVRTPTHKLPVTEYAALREKASSQKRDIEKALTQFITRTGDVHSLFSTEDTMFPLIACKPQFPPYRKALLPEDQVFDYEDESHDTAGDKIKEEEKKENDETCKQDDVESTDNPYFQPVKLPSKKKHKSS